ncbi:MAG: hypothetical protein MUO89_01005 [Dehalococcoidia bacterium]|nr:hypothetical protein [Dehalococcoidia bacterium]
MENSIDRIKAELQKLIEEGAALFGIVVKAKTEKERDDLILLNLRYQLWYTRALPVIQQLLPERSQEFQDYYLLNRRKQIDVLTYTINDYFMGLRLTKRYSNEEPFDSFSVFASKLSNQVNILSSAQTRITSILSNIKGILRAELFDTELKQAEELLAAGYLRPAGTVAGVVLEGHLSSICLNHSIKFQKKKLTISDYNEALKENVYDSINWRWVQRLSDIRNLCVHKKNREPTEAEVIELISGVDKVIKTIF